MCAALRSPGLTPALVCYSSKQWGVVLTAIKPSKQRLRHFSKTVNNLDYVSLSNSVSHLMSSSCILSFFYGFLCSLLPAACSSSCRSIIITHDRVLKGRMTLRWTFLKNVVSVFLDHKTAVYNKSSFHIAHTHTHTSRHTQPMCTLCINSVCMYTAGQFMSLHEYWMGFILRVSTIFPSCPPERSTSMACGTRLNDSEPSAAQKKDSSMFNMS